MRLRRTKEVPNIVTLLLKIQLMRGLAGILDKQLHIALVRESVCECVAVSDRESVCESESERVCLGW